MGRRGRRAFSRSPAHRPHPDPDTRGGEAHEQEVDLPPGSGSSALCVIRPDQPDQSIAAGGHAELVRQAAPRLATERHADLRLCLGEPPCASRPGREQHRHTFGKRPALTRRVEADVAAKSKVQADLPAAERQISRMAPVVAGGPVDAVMGRHRDRLLTSGAGLFRVVA